MTCDRKENNYKINIKTQGYRMSGVERYCYSGNKNSQEWMLKEYTESKIRVT